MYENLKRKENESIEAYQVRLTLMKQDGYDVDWNEIKDLLESDKNPDSIRKESYGIKIYDKYVKQQKLDNVSQETLSEIDEKILELKKEKRKLSDQRSLVNRKINEYARIENMTDIMREEIQKVYIESQLNVNNCLVTHETSNRDGVLLLSDVHYGLKIDNPWNYYDIDECKKRIEYVINKTIEYSKFHNIDKLHVFLLGDLMSGEIHSTIRLENQENLIKQIINISKILNESISILANQLPYVIVNISEGNHERINAKDENLIGDNYTELIRNNLEMCFENHPKVMISKNKYDDIIVTDICNKTVFASHGDKDSLNNGIQRLTSMLRIVPDYMFVGHYHKLKEDTFGETELVVNGSLSGMDSYARDKRLYSKPAQKFMIFNNSGRLCTYNIKF